MTTQTVLSEYSMTYGDIPRSEVVDIINKVLDEVKSEVEKEAKKIVDNRHPELGDAGANCECAQCMFSCGRKIGRKDISSIIDQLKIK